MFQDKDQHICYGCKPYLEDNLDSIRIQGDIQGKDLLDIRECMYKLHYHIGHLDRKVMGCTDPVELDPAGAVGPGNSL